MKKCDNLSVCILVLNEATHIKKCLKSISGWASEIIVTIDDLTSDETEKIVRHFTKKVYKIPHKDNFHINKQFTIKKATKPWVFWLDGDEEVSDNLKSEIEKEINRKTSDHNGYFLPRKNIIFGKWIKDAGWSPDHQLRLFKNDKLRFPCKRVHEHPVLKGSAGYLKEPLIHYNYQRVSQFIEKMNRYTSVDAVEFVKRFSPPYWKHFIHRPIDEFIKRFLVWRGYKDGLHGLVLSLLQAAYELVVVAKAWEMRKFVEEEPDRFIEKTEEKGKNILKTWGWWKKQIQIEESKTIFGKIFFKILRRLNL